MFRIIRMGAFSVPTISVCDVDINKVLQPVGQMSSCNVNVWNLCTIAPTVTCRFYHNCQGFGVEESNVRAKSTFEDSGIVMVNNVAF